MPTRWYSSFAEEIIGRFEQGLFSDTMATPQYLTFKPLPEGMI